MYDNRNETRGALLCALLMASVLVFSLILPTSAAALSAAQAEHPSLHRIAFEVEDGRVSDHDGIIGNSLRGADARVCAAKRARMAHNNRHTTDNTDRHMSRTKGGVRGMLDSAANRVKHAADDVVRGTENAIERAGNVARNAADDAQNALTPDGAPSTGEQNTPVPHADAPNADTPNNATPNAGAQDGTLSQTNPDVMNEGENSAGGVLGWIIAILVVLAIALVVLAVLPKKNRSRG